MKRVFIFFLLLCNLLAASVEDKLAFALEKLPDWNPETAKVTQASGGATNYGYIVKYKNNEGVKHRYFIRIQSENRKEASCDIVNEIQCQNIAADYHIAPKIVLAFPDEGIIVTHFIRTKENEVNFNDSEMLGRCLSLIEKIHRMPVSFPTSQNPYDLVEKLASDAALKGCRLSKEWDDTIAPAVEKMKRIDYEKCLSVPCHLDLSSDNLLYNGKRIWAIDWEYSANSDPFFDLGTLISGSLLDDAKLEEVFAGCCGPDDYPHFYRMVILAEIRWYLWCLIQQKTSPLDCPYGEWAGIWLQRALMKIEKSS